MHTYKTNNFSLLNDSFYTVVIYFHENDWPQTCQWSPDSGNPCDSDPGSNSQVNTARVPFVMDSLSLCLSCMSLTLSGAQLVKKPLNAFMLFMKEMRHQVLQEGLERDSAAINRILGRRVSV